MTLWLPGLDMEGIRCTCTCKDLLLYSQLHAWVNPFMIVSVSLVHVYSKPLNHAFMCLHVHVWTMCMYVCSPLTPYICMVFTNEDDPGNKSCIVLWESVFQWSHLVVCQLSEDCSTCVLPVTKHHSEKIQSIKHKIVLHTQLSHDTRES